MHPSSTATDQDLCKTETPLQLEKGHPIARRVSLIQDVPSPPLSQWRNIQSERYRISATFFSFLLLGAIDASYGALLPALQHHYNLSYILVSLIFLSPFIGYIIAALLNAPLHARLGHRGIAILGPLSHVLSFLIISFHPPWAVIIVLVVLLGFGNGILDAAWNAWIATMPEANQFMGALHSFYGAGATVCPLIATAMLNKAHTQWWTFYYVLLAASVVELVISALAFRSSGPSTPDRTQNSPTSSSSIKRNPLLGSLSHRATPLAAALSFLYVGTEVTLGGWLPLFLLRTRDATPFASGMVLTGFWLGVTLGTFALGFLTPHLFGRDREHRAVGLYIVLAVTFHVVFWRLPERSRSGIVGPAVAVALEGFFLGPVFPTAIVLALRALPPGLHVPATGLISGLGSGGGAVFPFMLGAIAERAGVGVLGPFVLGLLAVIAGFWILLPSGKSEPSRAADGPS